MKPSDSLMPAMRLPCPFEEGSGAGPAASGLPASGQCSGHRLLALIGHQPEETEKDTSVCLGSGRIQGKQTNIRMIFQQEGFKLQPWSEFSAAHRMALVMPSSQNAQIDYTLRISLAHKCVGCACLKVFSLSNEGNFFKLSQKACPGNGMCFYRNELLLCAVQKFNTHNGRLISR